MTHAERFDPSSSYSHHQGKVRVIAGMAAAARIRRTGEAPKKAQAGVHKKLTASQASELAGELKQVTAVLEDYKAQDIVVIPLAGQASFADYLVIASGTSSRHVSSMGQGLLGKLGKAAVLGVEGLQDGEWVCVDMGNIVIHIFVPEKRVLYNLEKLWSHVFTPAENEGTP